MQVPASLAGFPKLIYKYIQSLQVRSKQCHVWCHSYGHHTMRGVIGTVVVPHVVLWALSLCCVLCRGHYHCTTFCLQVLSLHGHGGCRRATFCVVGAVVAWPQWVLCCGHICCMAAVGVVMPHFVLWALSLHGHGGRRVVAAFVVQPWWVSSHHVVSQS